MLFIRVSQQYARSALRHKVKTSLLTMKCNFLWFVSSSQWASFLRTSSFRPRAEKVATDMCRLNTTLTEIVAERIGRNSIWGKIKKRKKGYCCLFVPKIALHGKEDDKKEAGKWERRERWSSLRDRTWRLSCRVVLINPVSFQHRPRLSASQQG